MSRSSSLILLAALMLAQAPALAGPHLPRFLKHQKPVQVHTNNRARKTLVSKQRPIVHKDEAADSDDTEVITQPAVMPDDSSDFQAPAGALYTNSDDCG